VAVVQAAIVMTALGAFVFTFGPTKSLIQDRVATPHSNQGRQSLYAQSIALAAKQPLVGYGGPQQSTAATKSSNYKHPDVGTQGQLWTILVSHGLPATIFFFGYFAVFVWQTRRAKSALTLWCHIVVVVALFQSPFYGLLAAQLHLVFVAIGLASREIADPDPPPPDRPKAKPRSLLPPDAWAPRDLERVGVRPGGPWGPWPERAGSLGGP
jgi:O-antigen ligase